jgi:hypothetical protein
MTTWHINRLSREWVGPITVAADGTPVIGWTYALVPEGETPATVDEIAGVPSALEGGLGVLVGPGTDHVLDPGTHVLWVRYVDEPEAPVLADVGRVTIHRGAQS